MEKKIFSIGYKDKYNDFTKVCDYRGTKKFSTIQECKDYIINNLKPNTYKIMKGWEVVEVVEKKVNA